MGVCGLVLKWGMNVFLSLIFLQEVQLILLLRLLIGAIALEVCGPLKAESNYVES
jgi:hypothetical protein